MCIQWRRRVCAELSAPPFGKYSEPCFWNPDKIKSKYYPNQTTNHSKQLKQNVLLLLRINYAPMQMLIRIRRNLKEVEFREIHSCSIVRFLLIIMYSQNKGIIANWPPVILANQLQNGFNNQNVYKHKQLKFDKIWCTNMLNANQWKIQSDLHLWFGCNQI